MSNMSSVGKKFPLNSFLWPQFIWSVHGSASLVHLTVDWMMSETWNLVSVGQNKICCFQWIIAFKSVKPALLNWVKLSSVFSTIGFITLWLYTRTLKQFLFLYKGSAFSSSENLTTSEMSHVLCILHTKSVYLCIICIYVFTYLVCQQEQAISHILTPHHSQPNFFLKAKQMLCQRVHCISTYQNLAN